MGRLLTASMLLLSFATSALFALDPVDRLLRAQSFSESIHELRKGTLQSLVPSAAIANSILSSENVFSRVQREQLLLALLIHVPEDHEKALVGAISRRMTGLEDWSLMHALLQSAVDVEAPGELQIADLILDRYLESNPEESEAQGAVPAILLAIGRIGIRKTPTTLEILRTVASRSTDAELVRKSRRLARSIFARSN